MARKKTRAEKIRSAYRLKEFRLVEESRVQTRDAEAFGYLDVKFVFADLAKTLIVSVLMVILILLAKKYLV